MIEILQKSLLFKGLSTDEISEFVTNSDAFVKKYDKGSIIFDVESRPEYVYILLDGSIAICKDSISGKRMVMTNIDDVGDIFAEVYLFLKKESYDFYTISLSNSTKVLQIPKNIFIDNFQGQKYNKLAENMLSILSQKAYNLTQKLQILASGSLRQKLAKLLLSGMDKNNRVALGMTREQMADYLNVARPSLSRELANMQSEGYIEIKGQNVKILDPESLEYEL